MDNIVQVLFSVAEKNPQLVEQLIAGLAQLVIIEINKAVDAAAQQK